MCTIDILPDEIILIIMNWTPGKDLIKLSFTNHRFNDLCKDVLFWKKKYLANFSYIPPPSLTWKESHIDVSKSLYYIPVFNESKELLMTLSGSKYISPIEYTNKIIDSRLILNSEYVNMYTDDENTMTAFTWIKDQKIQPLFDSTKMNTRRFQSILRKFQQIYPGVNVVTGRDYEILELSKSIPGKIYVITNTDIINSIIELSTELIFIDKYPKLANSRKIFFTYRDSAKIFENRILRKLFKFMCT